MNTFLHSLYRNKYNDDIEKISIEFKYALDNYMKKELIDALNVYLDTHEKLVEFSQLLIKLEINRLEKK
jgi:hypothetical protein